VPECTGRAFCLPTSFTLERRGFQARTLCPASLLMQREGGLFVLFVSFVVDLLRHLGKAPREDRAGRMHHEGHEEHEGIRGGTSRTGVEHPGSRSDPGHRGERRGSRLHWREASGTAGASGGVTRREFAGLGPARNVPPQKLRQRRHLGVSGRQREGSHRVDPSCSSCPSWLTSCATLERHRVRIALVGCTTKDTKNTKGFGGVARNAITS